MRGMNEQLDLKVAELLCSRLCHDLISPISAINNGIELIAEMGDEARPDADVLIAESARNANRRLRIFRYAYGLAGQDVGMEEARSVAAGYFDGSKITLQWPDMQLDLPSGVGKILLNLVLLAPDLVYGDVKINVAGSPGEAVVTFGGNKSKLDEDLRAALDGAVLSDNLDPRTAHGVLIAAQCKRIGATLTCKQVDEQSIALALKWAKG